MLSKKHLSLLEKMIYEPDQYDRQTQEIYGGKDVIDSNTIIALERETLKAVLEIKFSEEQEAAQQEMLKIKDRGEH
ncbi:MAG: hypothetical protein UR28_C0002G0015 [Candidatus Peregrinibacteria bacterium GW2011_GWF2_33_10]|nr:MAG: hypothetical protein UR28_C0002G0015 [Candidatus Peregrinibacteria bacterium GW2011_GWF2_33_10]OGJ45597.1 MAG: hypothetical protein A2263_00650 [Candidatus Peregrinibacteria bacterium RIFOXYA2_FULL_33_21]OGJ45975.1 MAG: hypothetical protein A2272_04505 [Candidatus Peregrinibacteria bacterium RIFOXYA12_FULL_33_12]OGJ51074.1 MAG: hypothetical protein A2307_06360 [Candidatus Peregrinibacteria bacterium RIFOXYB2_FULL_33_20]